MLEQRNKGTSDQYSEGDKMTEIETGGPAMDDESVMGLLSDNKKEPTFKSWREKFFHKGPVAYSHWFVFSLPLWMGLCFVLFYLSLAPMDDPDRMTDDLKLIAIELVLDVIIFMATFYVHVGPAWKHIGWPLRVFGFACFAGYLVAMICNADGNNLVEHGAYSMAVFFLLIVIFLIPIGIYKLLIKIFKKPLWVLVAVAVVLLVWGLCIILPIEISLSKTWPVGFNNVVIDNDNYPKCRIETPGTIAQAFVPEWLAYPLSIFPCKSYDDLNVTVSKDDVITMDCPEGGKIKVYRPFEDKLTDFMETVDFVQKVRNEWGTVDYDYTGPMKLELENIHAFLAECGSEDRQKMVIHITGNKSVEERATANAEKVVNETGYDGPDVAVIFIDAISRQIARKKLPDSFEFLEKVFAGTELQTHEAFQFMRYHANWVNTGPNVCNIFQSVGKNHDANHSIWEAGRESGYVTMFSDDQCQGGVHLGFRNPPDYYLNAPFCDPEFQPDDCESTITQGAYSYFGKRCLRGRPVHEYVFEGLKSFTDRYPNNKKFSVNYFLEAHEMFSNILIQMDDGLLQTLQGNLIDLSNTVLFIIADHGLHLSIPFLVGADSATTENRLPFLVALFPKKYLDAHPEFRTNLKANEQALITGRDVNALWTHIMTGQAETVYQNPYGISPMGFVIPDRTCDDAFIDPSICKCNRHDAEYVAQMEQLHNQSGLLYYSHGCDDNFIFLA